MNLALEPGGSALLPQSSSSAHPDPGEVGTQAALGLELASSAHRWPCSTCLFWGQKVRVTSRAQKEGRWEHQTLT